MMEQIIRLFPAALRESVKRSGIFEKHLEEIRIRVNEPLIFRTGGGEYFLREDGLTERSDEHCRRISAEEIRQMSAFMSGYSLYACEEEIKKGYLTVEGGHRIGVCGQVSFEDGRIRRISPISYLNIRIAGERKGCAQKLLPKLLEKGAFANTLILSAPGVGKTTLLRDLVRILSDGADGFLGRKVGLVDERSEIAGCKNGVPQNDVGMRTDVLDGCPKAEGMMLLIRSMSPEILAVDEIGGKRDIQALCHAMRCGCRVVATIHSRDLAELSAKPGWEQIRAKGLFERYVALQADRGIRSFSVYDGGGRQLC